MDRIPHTPPFPLGATLVYIGPSTRWADPEGKRPLLAPGMKGSVVRLGRGYQGSLAVIDTDEETGEKVLERTHDGWSTIRLESGYEMAVSRERMNEWAAQ